MSNIFRISDGALGSYAYGFLTRQIVSGRTYQITFHGIEELGPDYINENDKEYIEFEEVKYE